MITKYDRFLSEAKKVYEPSQFYGIEEPVYDENGFLNCRNVDINKQKLNHIPFRFGKIEFEFHCKNNKITSLVNAPYEVGNQFDCSFNKLTSLVGGSKIVGDDYNCNHNKLVDLIGCPDEIKYDFNCSHNELTSTVGCPKTVGGNFYCHGNKGLTSIEDYPVCLIGGEIMDFFELAHDICAMIKRNREAFVGLLNNRVRFHQQIMRLMPELPQFLNRPRKL